MGGFFREVNSNLGEQADLLWTNPNPNSTFIEQEIELQNLSQYEAIIITAKHYCDGDLFPSRFPTYIDWTYTGNMATDNYYSKRGYAFMANVYCRVFIPDFDNNTAWISPQFLYGGSTYKYNVCIPLAIYGFKKRLLPT